MKKENHSMSSIVRRWISRSVIATLMPCVVNAASPMKPLQKVLNKSDYNLVYPAQSNIF
jgi:hypothetical protein